MNNEIAIAKKTLLEPAGLDESSLDRLMGQLVGRGIDHADLYFQYLRHESWSLEDGEVKSGSYNIDQGAGLRVVSGEKTGFAYSDELGLQPLSQAATAARAIARQGGSSSGQPIPWTQGGGTTLYQGDDPILSFSDSEKVTLLERIEGVARGEDPRVKEVMASLSALHEVILIVRSDGLIAADVRPLVRVNVSVIVDEGGRRERGSAGGGGRSTYPIYLGSDQPELLSKEAVRQALVNLEAIDSPAGTMEVVLGPGWPGILLHEAIGHGLEGDFNRKGTSAFSGRIGEKVGSPLCTVVDDGTLPGRRGSLSIDDEGTPSQNTVLIENGILKGYMQDSLNGRLMGVGSTGNGRRESFAHLPLPRMTNTYMLPGKSEPDEIVASVERGLYAVNFGGGQVDITSGKFVFSASEAYLIEGGKIGAPVKGATLIGDGPEVLKRVTMVGNDLELDQGVGTCGKEGQSVPVGVGQPTLKVEGMTVGGVEV